MLKKRQRVADTVQTAVSAHEESLRLRVCRAAWVARPSERFGLDAPMGAVTDQVIDATVLFSDIRNFTALAERLSSQEVAELLTVYFERTCEPILKNGGRHLKFIGDGLMAVFSETTAARHCRLRGVRCRPRWPWRWPRMSSAAGCESGLPTAGCRRLPLAWACTRAKLPCAAWDHPEQGNHAHRRHGQHRCAAGESSSKDLGWTVVASSSTCWPRPARACRPAA
jgi:class 3 adenylate cyclase